MIDEAHQLEDIATQYFGIAISNYRLQDLAGDLERLEASGTVSAIQTLQLARAVQRLDDDARAFFAEVAYTHRTAERSRGEEKVSMTAGSLAPAQDAAAQLLGALELLESLLASARPSEEGLSDAESPGGRPDSRALARRASDLRRDLKFLVRADDASFVYYVEFRGKGVFLRASPIDVSRIVRERLLDRMRSVVLTSATLTVDGSFDYVRGRLGVETAAEIRCPSEFDFPRQAILYLPKRMPDPRSAEFPLAAGREVVEILKRRKDARSCCSPATASCGRCPDRVHLEMALSYPILLQGTAPRSAIAPDEFRSDATLPCFSRLVSFWQGVDVAGER